MDAAIAGLVGVAVGSISSFAGLWLQQRQQARHERLKMAVELATHDHEQALALAKSSQGARFIPPLVSFVMYHADVLSELSVGAITPDKIKILSEKHSLILNAFGGAPDHK